MLTRHVASSDGELHDLVVHALRYQPTAVVKNADSRLLTLIPMQGKQLCWAFTKYSTTNWALGSSTRNTGYLTTTGSRNWRTAWQSIATTLQDVELVGSSSEGVDQAFATR